MDQIKPRQAPFPRSRMLSALGRAWRRLRAPIEDARFRAYPAKVRLTYPLKRRMGKKVFVVLATPRSGTNLLLSYLNALPGVRCYPGEILHFWHLKRMRIWFSDPRKAVDFFVRALYDQSGRICGLKLMHWQMKRFGIEPGEVARQLPEARYLIVYRRSLLQQFVSFTVATHNGEWVRRTGDHFSAPPPIEPFRVDRAEFLSYCEGIRAFYRSLAACEPIGSRAVWIGYEELAEDHQRVLRERVAPLLGVRVREVVPGVEKIVNRPPSELILNYEEIRDLESSPSAVLERPWEAPG